MSGQFFPTIKLLCMVAKKSKDPRKMNPYNIKCFDGITFRQFRNWILLLCNIEI